MIKSKTIPPKGAAATVKNGTGAGWGRYFRDYWQLYLLIIPAVVFTIIFCYYPMYGAQIAFRDYKFSKGFFGSEWVGLKHFERYITSSNFWTLLRNTLVINLHNLLVGFPAPIILSLMLNELGSERYKKTVQMIIYAPHFISVVTMCGMVRLFLQRETGVINILLMLLGGTGQDWLSKPEMFSTIYVLSGVWQNVGWGTIIYLAALSGVDPQIIEAAKIDGASRFQKIIYIDLPSILPTVTILLIMTLGSMMSTGFEKVLLLQNQLNIERSDVFATFVYRLGIKDAQYSYTTAVGLFNSVVNVILLASFNWLAKVSTKTSLW